jgi:hypothetical protein
MADGRDFASCNSTAFCGLGAFHFLGSPLNLTPNLNLNLIPPSACGLGAGLRLGMTTQKSGMRLLRFAIGVARDIYDTFIDPTKT